MNIAQPYRRRGWPVCLLACLLAGCGGSDSTPSAQPTAATSTAPTSSETSESPDPSDSDASNAADANSAEAAAVATDDASDSAGEPAVETSQPTSPSTVAMSGEAFRLAAYEGRIESVRRGIEAGMDAGAANERSLTALHMAAYNGHSDIVKLLLAHDVEVDPRDAEGKTPLLHACTGPFANTVEILIDAGADVNAAESTESFTPLMMAAGLGQTEVVELLLRHDADKSTQDADKDRAIDHARNSGHAAIVKLLE